MPYYYFTKLYPKNPFTGADWTTDDLDRLADLTLWPLATSIKHEVNLNGPPPVEAGSVPEKKRRVRNMGLQIINGIAVRDDLSGLPEWIHDRWIKAPAGEFAGAGKYWQIGFGVKEPWLISRQLQESPGPAAYVKIAGERPKSDEFRGIHTWWRAAVQHWEDGLADFDDALAPIEFLNGLTAIQDREFTRYGCGKAVIWKSVKHGWSIRFVELTRRPEDGVRRYLDFSVREALERPGMVASSVQMDLIQEGTDPTQGGKYLRHPAIGPGLWQLIFPDEHVTTG